MAAVVMTLSAPLVSRSARADEPQPPAESLFALGGKAGIIPPILAVGELIVRPVPKLALGVFGMHTGGAGIGNGGPRTSVGGEIVYESREGRRNTPYVSFAYDYYHANTDANGFYETSQVAYLTGGYVLKGRYAEFYAGGGLIFFLVDDTPPCTGFCVLDSKPPPVFPTLELGLRFPFL